MEQLDVAFGEEPTEKPKEERKSKPKSKPKKRYEAVCHRGRQYLPSQEFFSILDKPENSDANFAGGWLENGNYMRQTRYGPGFAIETPLFLSGHDAKTKSFFLPWFASTMEPPSELIDLFYVDERAALRDRITKHKNGTATLDSRGLLVVFSRVDMLNHLAVVLINGVCFLWESLQGHPVLNYPVFYSELFIDYQNKYALLKKEAKNQVTQYATC